VTPDAPPPTRRALRSDGLAPGDETAPSEETASGEETAPERSDAPGTLVMQQPADPPIAVEASGPVALAWVDETRITVPAPPTGPSEEAPAPAPDLLSGARRRSPWRPAVLIPAGLLVMVVAVYAAAMLVWPLHAVAPRVEPVAVQALPSSAAAPAWPAEGSAAVTVAGIPGALASTGNPSSIASIAKVVTALLVLDRMPLAVGESGPEYRFTAADRTLYWQYRAGGESALDVPVGGTLTQYQLLEGLLIGSANNYADRLAADLWPSDAVYAAAARAWLDAHGLPEITIVDPSGIGSGNAASPEALLALAERAMADPVIAEIVGKQSTELPGAGTVENSNRLLADPGMAGVKTGTLDRYNLLTAKDVVFGDTSVRIYAAVLGQPDSAARDAATRALFAQIEQELQPRPSVTAGTLAGQVVTRWGEPVDVVTADDASVILWNGAAGSATAEFSLADSAHEGDVAGTLAVSGPLNSTTVDLELAADVEGPSAWWRLTHPLELLGLG
jgi:D-alanyl-D-alanine carboxypeptidase (penicillin-binding protein 5/6)